MTPTLDQVKTALRIDDTSFDAQINDLIEQVKAETLAKLDRNVYNTQAELTAANDPNGIVVTKDMINAQILLIGFYLDQIGTQDGERTRAAAMGMLDRYRLSGA